MINAFDNLNMQNCGPPVQYLILESGHIVDTKPKTIVFMKTDDFFELKWKVRFLSFLT